MCFWLICFKIHTDLHFAMCVLKNKIEKSNIRLVPSISYLWSIYFQVSQLMYSTENVFKTLDMDHFDNFWTDL